MTKIELRELPMHALIGRIIDLERLRDEGRPTSLWQDQLAAAKSVYKMRMQKERIARRDASHRLPVKRRGHWCGVEGGHHTSCEKYREPKPEGGYGVFVHAHWDEQNSRVIENSSGGYVVRPIQGNYVPYMRMKPIRVYKSKAAADKYADELTFGKSRDMRRRTSRRDHNIVREKQNKEKWNKRFEAEAHSLGAPSHVNWSKGNQLRLKGSTPEQAARSLYRNAERDRPFRRRLHKRGTWQTRRADRLEFAESLKRNRKGYLTKSGRKVHRDVLTTRKRRALRKTQFALPGRHALPIENGSHARNAAARLEQMRKRGTVTPDEYRTAYKRIKAAERRFGSPRRDPHSRQRAAYDQLNQKSKNFLNAYTGDTSDRRVEDAWQKLTASEQRGVLQALDAESIRKGGRQWGARYEGFDNGPS